MFTRAWIAMSVLSEAMSVEFRLRGKLGLPFTDEMLPRIEPCPIPRAECIAYLNEVANSASGGERWYAWKLSTMRVG